MIEKKWTIDSFMKNEKHLSEKRAGYAYVLTSAILWGTLPVFSTCSYRLGSDAMTSAAMRSYLSCLLFLMILICSSRIKEIRLKELKFYIAYGVIAGGGTFLSYMSAIEHLTPSMAAILLYTGPAFVIVFDRILYKEPLTRIKLISIICTLLGCLLVLKAYQIRAFQSSLRWILVGLLSGICYAMTTVMGKKAKNYHQGELNAGMLCIFGALVFLPVKAPWSIRIETPLLFFCYLGLAVLGTVLPYMIYLKGLDRIKDGGTASILATMEPVAGSMMSALFLGERYEIWQIVGICIVVLGVCFPILREPAAGRER